VSLLDLKLDTSGKLIKSPVSTYKPSKPEKERLAQIKADWLIAREQQRKPYREFNDLSMLDRRSLDQSVWNTYVEPQSQDPDEKWKSQAMRPVVRNRLISIAAHITGALIFPQVYAQNDQDEQDKDAAEVMRDLMEAVADQTNYSKTFLYTVIAMLVNPGAIVHTEFAQIYRKVKQIQESGKWSEKEVLDELYSGFQDTMVPLDELLLGNIREQNIQKQTYLVWRRVIDYTTALAKHGSKANFKYVRPGVQLMYDEPTDQFYEIIDENLRDRLVEEVIYFNRAFDLQVACVNGVMMDDADQPNPREDKRYPFVMGGYELIDPTGQFAYYYSLVRKMAKDEEVINTLYRLVIDGAIYKLKPAMAVYGDEEFDSSVTTPGTLNIMGSESKMEPIDAGGDIAAGMNVIEKVEQSLQESSNDPIQSGQPDSNPQTAFEISRLEQNAKVMLGLFAKMIGFLIKDFGELRISDILQFMTVGEADEELGDETRLKFQTILIPNKNSQGKDKTRRITFDQTLPNQMTPDQHFQMSRDTFNQEGGLNTETEIYRVNPELFRKRKFTLRVTPDVVSPPSDNLKKAFNLELYDRAIQNPLANQEQVTRDLLFGSYDATKGNTDKYIAKPQPANPLAPPVLPGQSQALPQATGQQQPSPLKKLIGGPAQPALTVQ